MTANVSRLGAILRIPLVLVVSWVIAALTAVNVYIYVGKIAPALREDSRLEAQVSEINRAIVQFDRRRSLAAIFRQRELEVNQYQERLRQPNSAAVVARRLGRLARQNRLDILHGASERESFPNSFYVIRQELTLDGQYSGVRGFLAQLQKLPIALNLSYLEINRIPSTTTVQAKLGLDIWTKQVKG